MADKGKSKTEKVGTTVEVEEGGTVVRPDGSVVTVTGGLYVLDVPGTFEVGGSELEVK